MSVYRDKKEWNKWNEMVTASEHATEDFNDFADDAAIIKADKKMQSLWSKNLALKSELEALREIAQRAISFLSVNGIYSDDLQEDLDKCEVTK